MIGVLDTRLRGKGTSIGTVIRENAIELANLRILVADSHELFKRALKLFLEDAGLRVIGSTSTGRQTIEATVEYRPDVLILDIAMQDIDGLATLAIVKFLAPETHVIILSSLTDSLYLSRATELGAMGFFFKGVSIDQIIQSIRKIVANETSKIITELNPDRFVPTAVGDCVPKKNQTHSNGSKLTKKETLILSLATMGNDNQEIAEKASITQNTLKTHMRKIYTKLGVSDRSQAVICALRNGF
jgi:NarL family two-component system response regulator LiaR